ncbi:AAA family ATPase [Polaromonas sp. P1(28)-8]|nr:AAA family ATPase [Polaromonas sp. P1(28)-8]
MKIAVVSRNDKHLAEIARLLHERNPADGVDVVYGALEKLAGIADLSSPDVLVLDQPSVEGGDLERLERLSHLYPRMAFILLCQQKTPEFLIQAMRAGVREVLPSPVDASELVPAIERIEQKLESGAQANGQVLAFVSCKGGSGATFLATNLGYALAVQGKKRVALIDLNLQFGDASLFVSDQKPQVTLSEVCQQIHRLDPSFFASSMLSIEPNYGVLAAPEDPTHASYVKPEHIDMILKLARRHYDFILLDMGRSLDAVSIRAGPGGHDFPDPADHPALHPGWQTASERFSFPGLPQGQNSPDREPAREKRGNQAAGPGGCLRHGDLQKHTQPL